MSELNFEFDWVDSEGIRGAELSTTWASLKIAVGDSVVTRIEDKRAKTVRDFVYVPLYPLAEWLATNWWFLTHEFQNPDRQGDREFQRRHSLGANREGYAYPDLEVVSSGSRTTLAWKRCTPQWTRVEFLSQGRLSVDRLEFRQACYELIDSVIRRLAARGIEDTLLQQEWAAVQASEEDAEELQFCHTAAGLGWDPYDLLDSERDEIFQLAHELGAFVGEAVQALNASSLRVQSSAIVSAIEYAGKNGLPLDSLRSFHVDQGDDLRNALPWRVGYGWARRLRQKLDVGGQPLASTEELADALGEDQVGVDMAIQSVESLTRAPLVDGLVSLNSDETASFAFRPAGEAGRRFSFCRALGELLASPQAGSLITKSHTERQQFNRAFAAEFLAPSLGLKERVHRLVVHEEEVGELSEEFGVSPKVIEHQIENHGIAQLAEPTLNRFA
jgi:hypothetical protein